jgi:lactoylglutathione lyase
MIKRLAHLCFFTNQLNEMIDFYHQKLNLNLKFKFTGDDGQEFGCYFELGEMTFLEIFDQQGATKQWGGQIKDLEPEGRYQHFCLETVNLEDVCQNLKQKGVEVTPIQVGMDQSKQAWIKDPDGNRIELMEYTAKSWQLKA